MPVEGWQNQESVGKKLVGAARGVGLGVGTLLHQTLKGAVGAGAAIAAGAVNTPGAVVHGTMDLAKRAAATATGAAAGGGSDGSGGSDESGGSDDSDEGLANHGGAAGAARGSGTGGGGAALNAKAFFQEEENTSFCPAHGQFHTVVLKGLRNISGTL